MSRVICRQDAARIAAKMAARIDRIVRTIGLVKTARTTRVISRVTCRQEAARIAAKIAIRIDRSVSAIGLARRCQCAARTAARMARTIGLTDPLSKLRSTGTRYRVVRDKPSQCLVVIYLSCTNNGNLTSVCLSRQYTDRFAEVLRNNTPKREAAIVYESRHTSKMPVDSVPRDRRVCSLVKVYAQVETEGRSNCESVLKRNRNKVHDCASANVASLKDRWAHHLQRIGGTSQRAIITQGRWLRNLEEIKEISPRDQTQPGGVRGQRGCLTDSDNDPDTHGAISCSYTRLVTSPRIPGKLCRPPHSPRLPRVPRQPCHPEPRTYDAIPPLRRKARQGGKSGKVSHRNTVFYK